MIQPLLHCTDELLHVSRDPFVRYFSYQLCVHAALKFKRVCWNVLRLTKGSGHVILSCRPRISSLQPLLKVIASPNSVIDSILNTITDFSV